MAMSQLSNGGPQTYPYAQSNTLQYAPRNLSNFNSYNNTTMTPFERGSISVHNRFDFFRNMWGIPDDLERLLQSNPNMQPLDLIGQYKDRELIIPSNQLTAMTLNSEGFWLSETAAPIFPTAEFNFTGRFREMNMLEYTRTAAGGIPNEQTFRATSWKDTIEKFQLNARIEMDFALDPNFGAEEWLFQLAGLAANAMLTIHKMIAYSIIHIAYTNMVGEDRVKNNPYDLSKILEKEEEYFGIAAFDSVKFLRMIRRMEDTIPNMDLVIIPYNAAAYLAELLGESTSMISQKVITDTQSGALLWQFGQGKRSVGTVTYGEQTLHFVEMPQFRVNMEQDSSKEQPLKTSTTIAQVYPPDPDVKADDNIVSLREDNLDMYIFFQTKNQGDEMKVSIKEAYNAAFYWNEDEPDHMHRKAVAFCRMKSQQVLNDSNLIPWEWNPLNKYHSRDINDMNKTPMYDNNSPNMDYLLGKEKLEAMRGWRDRFFGLTYLPDERVFRIPKRIADFELNAIPNNWIHKSARAIAHYANTRLSTNMDFDSMVEETNRLLDDICASPWTQDYIVALINANIDSMYNYNELDPDTGLPTFKPSQHKSHIFTDASRIDEWVPNRHGSLNLPRKTNRITQIYPPGFAFGAGLVTLSKEADDDTSEWREVGLRAKRVVHFWETFSRLLKETIGEQTDVLNSDYTPPWVHVPSEITVLIDSYRHYQSPVFLAVPVTVVENPDTIQTTKINLKSHNTDETKDIINRFVDSYGQEDRGNLGPNAQPIRNIVKFAVILDAYSSKTPSERGGVIGDRYGSRILEILSDRLVTPLFTLIAQRLIDYTIETVYNKYNKSKGVNITKQLNFILYVSWKLILTNFGGSESEKDNAKIYLEAINKELDTFMNLNGKSAQKNALEFYNETVLPSAVVKRFEQNMSRVEDTINRLHLAEKDITENYKKSTIRIPPTETEINKAENTISNLETKRLTEELTEDEVGLLDQAYITVNYSQSYDESLRIINEYDRLKVKQNSGTLTLEERVRLDNLERRIRILDLYNTTILPEKTTIHMDVNNPQFTRYLRAPLMGCDKLFDYLQRTPNPLIKPSDPYSFHEQPIDIISSETLRHHRTVKTSRIGDNLALHALPYSQLFKKGISSNNNNSSSSFGKKDTSDIFSNNLSSTRNKKSTSKSLSLSNFLPSKSGFQFGQQNDDEMEEENLRDQYDKRKYRDTQYRPFHGESDNNLNCMTPKEREDYYNDLDDYLKKEEYFGPYKGRFEYMQSNISSPFVKIIFKAIMFAPNRIIIHQKLAAIGQKLINVLLFRLFIQHVMSSTIIMKAGMETLRTAIGHSKVWVNSEQRGINIINAGFYGGTVRVNPGAIQMLPFTFPEAFIGGMNMEFMREISHFRYRTTDKESIIAVISPVNETRYEYPIHILNLPTYNRRDTSNAPHLRKWSSSEYIAFVINEDKLYEIEGHISKNKQFYGHAFDISLCCHRGFVRYINANDVHGQIKMVPGTGPRGHPRMNINGAERTWNGGSVKFPDMATDALRRSC